eukprot:Seg429.9 transcript_id=Seg429.9/GoldUCD/mRNA.D3Y31 product="Androgen-induced gene 1 protein" protein_id=Seg429.9/GoldUCD/D3Y31
MATKEFLVHLVFFLVFASTVYHNIANIFLEGITNSYGGRFKFLTFINLLMSVSYYGYAFVVDCLPTTGLSRKNPEQDCPKTAMVKLRDSIFGSILFPVSSIVTLAFWGVMIVNSELMLPRHLRHIIPVHGLYNHCAHTAPVLLAIAELLLVRHEYYPTRKRGSLFFTVFCVGYLSWIMWIAYHANIWVYPVLKVLSWPARTAFLGSVYLLGLGFFMTGYSLNSCKKVNSVNKLE